MTRPALGGGRHRTLSPRRRGLVRRVARQVCPSDVDALGLLDPVVDHVAATARSMSPLARRGLLLGIDLTVLGSRAPEQLRRPVRDVLVVAYFDQPEVRRRLGYDPDAWTAEAAGRWRAEWSGAIEAHRQLLVAPQPRPPLDR